MAYTSILNFVNTMVTFSMRHKKELDIYEHAGIKQRSTFAKAIFRNNNFLQ